MVPRVLSAPFVLAIASSAIAQSAAPLQADQAAMKAHVAYLASDALQGREAGTPGYDKGAAYVVEQMKAAGLQPAGEGGGWYQKVPLTVTKALAGSSMALDGSPLTFLSDYTLRPTPGSTAIDIEAAPVVFAGYGVVDAATGRDDYRGLDVRGKVVALFASGPKGLNSEVAAHLGNRVDRARLAKQHGAVGVLYLYTTQYQTVLPFERLTRNWDDRAMTWAEPSGPVRDLGAPTLGFLSFAGATKLFAGSKIGWDAVRAAEDAGQPVPTGPLIPKVTVHERHETVRLMSENVVGRLPGSDPKLRDQAVILSAHLDHIGITRPVNGDSINNGAMDNAMGIASLLEAAKLFQKNGDRPKRSVLFLAVTAEEKGLVGSDFFANHPTLPRASIVANVNLDMPILTYRFQDLVAFGAERSSIGPTVKTVASREGIALTPDPSPEEADFVRSDHYSFVRVGVPAISLSTGPGGPGKAAIEDFIQHHYHQPSDDMSLPFDWAAARQFVKINYLIGRSIADAPDTQRWVAGDYFGTLYKGPMAAK